MKTLAVARRELLGYFNQPVAYVVVATFLVLSGSYLFVLHPFFVVDRATMRPFFEFVPFLFTLLAPALTMRLIAEERRTGTLELLLSWPLADASVVVGKFLGALGLLAVALALTLVYPLAIGALGELDWGPVLGGYLGLLLLGAAYLSVGLLVSAWTDSQIVAFVGGFLACFAFYIVGSALPSAPAWMVPWLEALSFDARFQHVARGVIDTRDLAYFASVVFLALGLTAETLAARKWR
jgi:ABC-2 type transport system permease protein